MTKAELIKELEAADDNDDIYVMVHLSKYNTFKTLVSDPGEADSFYKMHIKGIVFSQFNVSLRIETIDV